MSIYLILLGRLAAVVSEMDFNRTRATHLLAGDFFKARNIIDQIKMEMLDIGELADLAQAIEVDIVFADMDSLKHDLARAHDEIIRLAGAQQHLIYGHDEDMEVAA